MLSVFILDLEIMTKKNKERLALALENAAALIDGHVEVGLFPDDVAEQDEDGLMEYGKACERAHNMILTLAKKYRR